jgi:hypothetical protein
MNFRLVSFSLRVNPLSNFPAMSASQCTDRDTFSVNASLVPVTFRELMFCFGLTLQELEDY